MTLNVNTPPRPSRHTCHNGTGTPGFHSEIDLRPVRAPEPLWGNLRAATVGIEDRGRRVRGDHALGQVGPHVERIKEPDQAEYAQTDGDVDEDFADVDFLFFLFAVERRGFLIFPGRGRSFPCHHPLPLPAHPTLLKPDGEMRKRNELFLFCRPISQKTKIPPMQNLTNISLYVRKNTGKKITHNRNGSIY